MASEFYEIYARAEGKAHTAEMAGPMLQVVLEQRFQLRVHKEPRDTPVYALTVAGDQPKLHPLPEGVCIPFDLDALVAAPDAPAPDAPEPGAARQCSTLSIAYLGPDEPQVADCYGMTMAEFAGRVLRTFTDRPVIDRTGLSGRFEIHLEALEIAPPSTNGGITPDSPPPAPDGALGPTVFQAVQKQLGLKLVPARAPVEVLVIDHAERPSEN